MRSDACMKFWGIVKGSVYSTYENGYKFLNYSFNSLQFSEGIPMDEEWPQEIEATFLLFQDKNDGSILSLVEEHKATFKITKRPCNYHDWFYRFNTTTTDGLLPPLTYCKY